MTRRELLQMAADDYGYDSVTDMLSDATFDSVCPAICQCGYSEELEPDGHCECPECGRQVRSVLLIAGLI